MKRKLPRGTLDRLWSAPENWNGLGVYKCAEDPRVIVPKRNPMMGWTVNCAHGSALLFLAVIVLSLMPAVYLKVRHEDAAGVVFVLGWIVAVVAACWFFSSASRHED